MNCKLALIIAPFRNELLLLVWLSVYQPDFMQQVVQTQLFVLYP